MKIGFFYFRKETSTLFPDNALHFLLIGTNLIADILSTEYPTITYCERDYK